MGSILSSCTGSTNASQVAYQPDNHGGNVVTTQSWPVGGLAAVNVAGTAEFIQRAHSSLDELNQTVAGAALLEGLRDLRQSNRYVTIHQREGGNDCQAVPLSDGFVSDSRTKLAQALIDGIGDQNDNNPAGNEIQRTLNQMEHTGAAGHAWLADTVNQTPIYNIEGMPATGHSNIDLTADEVAAWINGRSVFPAPHEDRAEDLIKVLLTALWPGSSTRPGNGMHSRVRWDPERSSITLTTDAILEGSNSISLAHELTHAYYNGKGLQLGNDNGHFSTVLCEYQAVGLGPWSGERFGENQFRAQWPVPMATRPCY